MENYKQWVIKQGIEKAVKSLSKEAGGKEVVELVKDPTWQKLRESFVGTWKKPLMKMCVGLSSFWALIPV